MEILELIDFGCGVRNHSIYAPAWRTGVNLRRLLHRAAVPSATKCGRREVERRVRRRKKNYKSFANLDRNLRKLRKLSAVKEPCLEIFDPLTFTSTFFALAIALS
jgi:hypothetical protein